MQTVNNITSQYAVLHQRARYWHKNIHSGIIGCELNYIRYVRKQGSNLDKEHRHDHVQQLVETTHETAETMLWNQQEKNGRTIANNKSHFIIGDNENGRCLLTDTAFSGDRNVIKKGA